LRNHRCILVAGGAGFIGSHFVDLLIKNDIQVIVVDSLTYAGRLENIPLDRIKFYKGEIQDQKLIQKILAENKVSAVVNFAAESHVDKSIASAADFIQTNIVGVFSLLEILKKYHSTLDAAEKNEFCFLQVSTDEVFGSLGETGHFNEESPFLPNSPYSASKAAADHLCRAWHQTYKFPVIVTHCSNNYGPRQFPEKLVPVVIKHALRGQPIPVYGKGLNVRDWIHVADHCSGILMALKKGALGQTYCFGGNSNESNIEMVKKICVCLDHLKPPTKTKSYVDLISFVTDRPGHDFRYSIDDAKARRDLGFQNQISFDQGVVDTVKWYLNNQDWLFGTEETK
jgi:dTDP-glucose 4,6-dehydratase